jgi:hypothetical protein
MSKKNLLDEGQSFGCRFRGELWYEYTMSYKYDSMLPEEQRAQDEEAVRIINYIKWAIEDEVLIRNRRRRKIAQENLSRRLQKKRRTVQSN